MFHRGQQGFPVLTCIHERPKHASFLLQELIRCVELNLWDRVSINASCYRQFISKDSRDALRPRPSVITRQRHVAL